MATKWWPFGWVFGVPHYLRLMPVTNFYRSNHHRGWCNCRASRINFFLVIWVEDQKFTKRQKCWPLGLVFGIQLGLWQMTVTNLNRSNHHRDSTVALVGWPLFLLNRVEHHKLNQAATKCWPFGWVFGVQLGLRQLPVTLPIKKIIVIKLTAALVGSTLFIVSRVEHQKLNQRATDWWPFGWVFGVQLGLWQLPLTNFFRSNHHRD